MVALHAQEEGAPAQASTVVSLIDLILHPPSEQANIGESSRCEGGRTVDRKGPSLRSCQKHKGPFGAGPA